VIFAPGTPLVAVPGPNAPVAIYYNPLSYATPSNYLPNFTLTSGATLSQFMLLYPSATKTADGTTAAILSGFNTTTASGAPTGVTLVAGPGASAVYD
ncbi:hypothetical protein, partial [Pseudomonas sp. FW306-02-H05-AA]|uniref:hypothetical protein n=1 Tax=Pseudomonas sp. FW306-02-H05-AA TaxID=2070657 RepID=UPI002115C08F